MSNKRTLQERGAEMLTLDFTEVLYPFTPNQVYYINLAYEPFILDNFWKDY